MKQPNIKIILGTSSKSRKVIFDTLGFDYEVMHPDIDEKTIRFEDPDKLVLAIAEAKADALVNKVSEPSLIITADTVVVWNNEIREKPHDKKQAEVFFRSYFDDPAETHTGLVATNTGNNKRAKGIDVARILYKRTPDAVIKEMIEKGGVLNAAGAFLVEDSYSQAYIERIEGTRDSLSGLPIALLERLIEEVS